MYVYNVTHQHSLPYMDVVRFRIMMIIMIITTMNYQGHDDYSHNHDDYDHSRNIDHDYLIMTSIALARRKRLILQFYEGRYFNSS